uniref:Uncharacterized protein n=1 Tax=Timema shepardi TaxID=629360 RepID=A0A7R9AZ73_TIMSH|nr:unnamed protein product [Timema shepardi]
MFICSSLSSPSSSGSKVSTSSLADSSHPTVMPPSGLLSVEIMAGGLIFPGQGRLIFLLPYPISHQKYLLLHQLYLSLVPPSSLSCYSPKPPEPVTPESALCPPNFPSAPLMSSLNHRGDLAFASTTKAKGFPLKQQRHSPLVLGCLLLVLPFLPAANLAVTVGFVVAERVLYIPSLGFVLLVVYGAQLLWAAFLRQRSLLLCVGLVVLLVLCTRTVVRNRDWSCRERLIMAGLKALPHNAKMHYNFANFQRDANNLELATMHYEKALK